MARCGGAAGIGGVVDIAQGNTGRGFAQLGISAALGSGIGAQIVGKLSDFFGGSNFSSAISSAFRTGSSGFLTGVAGPFAEILAAADDGLPRPLVDTDFNLRYF